MVHSIAKAQSSLISRHRFSGMFEAKLKIRQTDQMETEVGIAVLVVVYMRKIVPAFRADLSTPQQVSPESRPRLLTSLMTSFHARGEGAGSKEQCAIDRRQRTKRKPDSAQTARSAAILRWAVETCLRARTGHF